MSDILPASPASTGDESAYIEDTTLVEITGNSPKHSLLSEAHVLEDVMDEGAPLTLARIVSRLKVRRTSQASSHGCSASSSRSSDTFASSSASSLAPILDESLALSHTPSLSIALAPGASPLHPSDLELTRPADSSLEAKYQSMVLISLAARRDALTWRKMARYWEARARTAEARPSSGVTPSASGMSDLGAEPLDPDRLRAVRELMAARSIPESFLVGIPLEGDEGSAEAFSTSLLPQGNVDGSTEQDHRGGSACATGSRSSISEAASHPVPDKSRTETSKQGPKSVCRPTIAKPRATPVVAPQRRTVPVARSATVRPTPRPTTKVPVSNATPCPRVKNAPGPDGQLRQRAGSAAVRPLAHARRPSTSRPAPTPACRATMNSTVRKGSITKPGPLPASRIATASAARSSSIRKSGPSLATKVPA